jgi:outer membrane protein, heavy metal efflux system
LRLLGLPASNPLKLSAGIYLPPRLQPPEAARLLRGIQKRRLDLVALRRGYESQEAAVRAAILDQFPRINLGLTHAGDTSDVITTGFTFSIDLPIFDRNQAKITHERATRQRLFDEYVDRVAQARSDVTQFLNAVNNLNQQVAAALATQADLQGLEQNYREAMKENFISRAAYNGILDQLTQKRLEVINLEGQLMESKIALELASGFYDLDAAGAAKGRAPGLEQGDQR